MDHFYKEVDSRGGRLIWVGLLLGAFFWLLESATHVIVFQDSDFVSQLSRPETHEAWMRFTVVCLFVTFGIYAQRIVTERRRAERAAQYASAEMTQIFETAADGMRVVDKHFNVLRANETFSELSGLPKEDIAGKKCYDVFSGPLCKTVDCPLNRIMINGKRVESDTEKIRKDGSTIPCIVTATPFRDPEGRLVGIVEDFKDISERKSFEEELVKSQQQLRDLASHLENAKEQERIQIAREIHDELGQALTALKMDIHWIGSRLPEDNPVVTGKIKSVSELIDGTIQSVKRISSELRPGLLDDFGLSAAIEWQTEDFENRTGIACDILLEPDDIVLDQERSTAVFRIFQEALTNVARHAQATEVEVSLKEEPGQVILKVQDNGIGFREREISKANSFGLIGIRERVHSFHGKFMISRQKTGGTTLEVMIPTQNEDKIQ